MRQWIGKYDVSSFASSLASTNTLKVVSMLYNRHEVAFTCDVGYEATVLQGTNSCHVYLDNEVTILVKFLSFLGGEGLELVTMIDYGT